MIPDEKLSQGEHIKKTRDFRLAYRDGSSVRRGPLVLYKRKNDAGISRLGISISSRVIKRAVRRNRMKRILREVYRKHKIHIARGFDIVVVIKKEAYENPTYMIIEPLFLSLAKEARLLRV